MNRRETTNAIAVMQAWVDGKGAVQCIGKHREKCWRDCDDGSTCSWDWDTFTYRIKPKPIDVTAWALVDAKGNVLTVCYHHERALERVHDYKNAHIVECKGTYTCDT